MAIEAIAADVAITWLGAAGTALFTWHLARRDDRHELRAIRFLVIVLTALLLVRGFAWWLAWSWLDRVVLAIAGLLPLAITLFCERLLRRHHPRWLKLLALAVTAGFLLAQPFAAGSAWTLAFMTALAFVVAANGGLLLAARTGELGAEETRLARALVVVALVSVPLLLSDFRTLHAQVPVRMGAIAALLFVYVMLAAAAGQPIARLPLRLLGWLLAAVALAGVFAAVDGGSRALMLERLWRGIPVAAAWLMLAAVFGLSRSASIAHRANDFLRWLERAPMNSLDRFVQALADYPPTQDHIVLGGDDLAAYDAARLWHAVEAADGPVSLAWVRAQLQAADSDRTLTESAEQWLDVFERHEMTHALPVSARRPLVILLNLPVAAPGSPAYLRAAVLLRLARQLDAADVR